MRNIFKSERANNCKIIALVGHSGKDVPYEIGEDAMRRMRAQSVKNVKETNGRISFEQRMRSAGEE